MTDSAMTLFVKTKARQWSHKLVKRARATPENSAKTRELLEIAWISGYAEALADMHSARAAQPQGTVETLH